MKAGFYAHLLLIISSVLYLSCPMAPHAMAADQNPQSPQAVESESTETHPQLRPPKDSTEASVSSPQRSTAPALPSPQGATASATPSPQGSTPSATPSPQGSTPSATPSPRGSATSKQKVLSASAQQQLPEQDYWIDPDRPHIADSSVNVPKGLWLQENGFQQTYFNRRSSAFDFPESLIRLGVSNRTELRYNTPNALAASATTLSPIFLDERLRTFGLQSMQAGFKHRLGPIGPTKFQIAVNPYVSIPTGFGQQNSKHVDGFIKFPFSQELNEHWDIEGMQSLFYPSNANGQRNLDWQNSFVLNRSWGRQRNVFIEYVGDVFEHGPMSNLIHFGGAYRPTRRQQIDCQFGFRMNNSAPIAFFGCGYSFLLGNLNTPRLTPSRYRR